MTNKKEKLLNEGTIRRFMTLANIDSLSENFVDNKFVKEEEEIKANKNCKHELAKKFKKHKRKKKN